jgi:hypothetical protein
MPWIPVSINAGMSSKPIPPIAYTGIVSSFFLHLIQDRLIASRPKIGLKFSFVVVNRNGPNPI